MFCEDFRFYIDIMYYSEAYSQYDNIVQYIYIYICIGTTL